LHKNGSNPILDLVAFGASGFSVAFLPLYQNLEITSASVPFLKRGTWRFCWRGYSGPEQSPTSTTSVAFRPSFPRCWDVAREWRLPGSSYGRSHSKWLATLGTTLSRPRGRWEQEQLVRWSELSERQARNVGWRRVRSSWETSALTGRESPSTKS